MKRRQFLQGAAAVAGAATLAKPAIAQGTTEISFYYPVAVGGPITKLVDAMAADFEKENPSIKVKPIYSGSYQDTITKVLTAVKGGDVPQTAKLAPPQPLRASRFPGRAVVTASLLVAAAGYGGWYFYTERPAEMTVPVTSADAHAPMAPVPLIVCVLRNSSVVSRRRNLLKA